MSRPDLYDLLTEHGGMDLIDEDICLTHRIGRAKVYIVLVERAMMSDSNGLTYRGTPEVARRTGLHRRDVQVSEDVLQEVQLLVRTGRRRHRAVEYAVIPALLAEHYANATDVTDDVTDDVTGNVTGNVTGVPVTKKSEVKRTPPTPRRRRRVSDGDGGGEEATKNRPPHGDHPHETNVRNALAADGSCSHIPRQLHMSTDDVVALCYDFAGANGDPWYDGLMPIKADLATLGSDVRNPVAVLRHRRTA